MAFDAAFIALQLNEGKYSNNAADAGGETMYGITALVARRNGYQGAMIDLPLATASDIAKREYWDKYLCDQFDPRIGFAIFDAAYNGGHPALWLQQACGAAPDGIIGAQTIACVRASDPVKIIARFSAYRLKYLAGLSAWATFGRGWANRMANNLLMGAA